MRKHFLLLFLMAILPLTGWAETVATSVEGFTAVFDAMTYSGGEQALPVPTKLVKTGYADITTGITTTDWKNANNESVTKITNAGTYTCTIQAEGKDGTTSGVLVVAKFSVTVSAKDIPTGTAKITFGDTEETAAAMFGVTYSARPTGLTAAQWTTQTNAFTAALTYETNYAQWATAPAGGFNYTPIITDLQSTFTNYTFTPEEGDITVSPKALKDNMPAIKDAPYTGDNYAPNKTNGGLTLKDQERNKAMAEGTDYTIKYYGALNAAGTDVAGDEFTVAHNDLINVNTYYAKIFGKGNYDTESFVIKSFKVTQRSLAITTTDANKTYGDALAVPALTVDDYDGFQNGEDFASATKLNDITKMLTKLQDGDEDVTDEFPFVGTYTVAAYPAKHITDPAEADVPVEVENDEIFQNYKAIFFNIGEYKIAQKAITFAVKDQAKMHGTTSPLDNPDGVQITEANADKYITLPGLVAGDEWAVYPIVKVDGNKVVADLTNVQIVRNIGTLAAPNFIDATSNYKFNKTDGTYTETAGQFNVRVKSVTKVYDANRKLSTENAALDIVITGGNAEDRATAKPLILKAFSISEMGELTAPNDTKFPNVAEYAITFDESKLDLGTLSGLYTVEAFEGTYTITPRTIKELKAADLTYAVGETADAYTPNASNITITMPTDDEDYDGYTLTDTDKRILFGEIEFQFAAAITGDGDEIVNDATGAIRNGKEGATANDGVEIAYIGGGLTNFVVTTLTAGKLTVSAAAVDTEFDRNAANFYSTYVVGNNGKKIDVTFTNFANPLKAQKWNTLVLPFDITVAKLSQALGYALVNVINEETTTASDIRFKVEMGTIPANTPFLVKTAEEVDMNNVVIEGVVIKKSATNKPVVDLSSKGVKFYGLYVTKTGLSANERTVSNDTWIIANSKATLKPLAAYLETEAGAGARVFVEDLDENGTTAIKELSLSTMTATSVDGWYTLNGVKLQGVPTEKGIYINNGKKVVIK